MIGTCQCNIMLVPNFIPPNYQRLAYIEFTGAQYLQNFVFPTAYRYELKAYVPYQASTPYNCYDNSGATSPMMWFYPNELEVNGNLSGRVRHSMQYNMIHTIFIDASAGSTICYIDGARGSGSQPHAAGGQNVNMFHRDSYSDSIYLFKGKVYYFKIWNVNTLINHCVPVKEKTTDTLGFYDMETANFYTNRGSSTFIAGPVL